MSWTRDFLERSPMMEPLREHAAPLRGLSDWPAREALQALVSARNVTTTSGAPLRLVEPGGEAYEALIYLRGELTVRSRNWHDLFNVLAWLAYPKTKRELNRRHYLAWEAEREHAGVSKGARRSRVRDALTLFDESGAIVASSDSTVLDDVRGFRWQQLFWHRRERTRAAMRCFVFGHALFEKALQPYVGMTAHALLIPVSPERVAEPGPPFRDYLDTLVSDRIRQAGELAAPEVLAPLPLLGVPGWWPANEREAFYDNTAYFRRGRAGRGNTTD